MMIRRQATSLFCAVAALTLFVQVASAQDRATAEAVPSVLDLKKVKIEIVDALFVKELKGVNADYKAKAEGKYRGMILVLKVQKPAGEELTLNAQDMVLHYRFGSQSDIAKCSGISTFSLGNDMDRPMTLFESGRGGATTGPSTIKASVIYIDLFFQFMEPDTSELYLLFAQPIGVSFKTAGWR